MRKVALASAAVVAVTALASYAAKPPALPAEFNYLLFAQGHKIGFSQTTVTRKPGEIEMSTHTAVAAGEYTLDINSTTRADPKTFTVTYFRYAGVRFGTEISGEMWVSGDSIYGYTVENGQKYPATRKAASLNIVCKEDYVMSHEVLLARAYKALPGRVWEGVRITPSSFSLTPVKIRKHSDIVMESDLDEQVCEKLTVALTGAEPYANFYAPAVGLPVYMAFPAAGVEAFLQSFFGDDPDTYYHE